MLRYDPCFQIRDIEEMCWYGCRVHPLCLMVPWNLVWVWTRLVVLYNCTHNNPCWFILELPRHDIILWALCERTPLFQCISDELVCIHYYLLCLVIIWGIVGVLAWSENIHLHMKVKKPLLIYIVGYGWCVEGDFTISIVSHHYRMNWGVHMRSDNNPLQLSVQHPILPYCTSKSFRFSHNIGFQA